MTPRPFKKKPAMAIIVTGTKPATFISLVAIGGLLSLAACSKGTAAQREAKHIAAGTRYLNAHDYKKASVEFQIASQNVPTDAEPAYRLALAYMGGRDPRLAFESLQRAVALNPKHEGAQFQLALFKLGKGDPESVSEARATLLARLARHSDAETLGALALAEAKLGHKKEALQRLLAMVDLKPDTLRDARLTLAVLVADGDVATAREFAQAIVKRAPSSAEAAVLQAEIMAKDDVSGAQSQLSRALALKPDYRPALLTQLILQTRTSDTPGAEKTSILLSKQPDPRLWAAHARFLVSVGRLDEGFAEYQRVLSEHTDQPALRNELTRLLRSAGRTKPAEAIVTQTLAKHPHDTEALLLRASLELDNGNTEAAARDIKALRDAKVSSAGLSFEASRLFAARGQFTREGELLSTALSQQPRLLSARLRLAQLLTSSNKARNALVLLDDSTPEEKADLGFTYIRNSILLVAGDFEDARTSVAAALAKHRDPRFLYQDAALRIQACDLAGARKSIEEALKMAPTDPLGWTVLENVMRRQGEAPAFYVRLRQAASNNLQAAAFQKFLGEKLLQSGDKSGARKAFEAAKSAGGQNAEVEQELALLDVVDGDLTAAKARLLALVKSHDNLSSRLLLGDIEFKLGALALAIDQYQAALAMDPSNPLTLNNLAGSLAAQGHYDDALIFARKALALAPGNPLILDTVGWAYFQQRNYQAALSFLDQSLRGKDRPLARYHFAAGLLKAGDPSRAKTEYLAAVSQDPNEPARAEVARLFDGQS